jgi:hypothetical protein
MDDIKAVTEFLRKKDFRRIVHSAEWDGIFAQDAKTLSGFFFPADMSLEDAEKAIAENRSLPWGIHDKPQLLVGSKD